MPPPYGLAVTQAMGGRLRSKRAVKDRIHTDRELPERRICRTAGVNEEGLEKWTRRRRQWMET